MSNTARGNVLVAIQFALFATIALIPRGNAWPLPLPLEIFAIVALAIGGVAVVAALFALGKSLRVNPVPVASGELKTTGLYGLVRHPVYSGVLIGAAGYAVLSRSWFVVAAVLALFLLLSIKARFEERLLAKQYPDYPRYASRVGRFVPGVGRLPRATA